MIIVMDNASYRRQKVHYCPKGLTPAHVLASSRPGKHGIRSIKVTRDGV